MEFGIIYKATAPNGKAYIGQTIRTLAERKRNHRGQSHCRAFAAAIKKHGDAIVWETLSRHNSQEELNAAETAAIAQHNTIAPNGYNLKGGGANGKFSAETKAKMSQTARANLTPELTKKRGEGLRRWRNSAAGKKFYADKSAAADSTREEIRAARLARRRAKRKSTALPPAVKLERRKAFIAKRKKLYADPEWKAKWYAALCKGKNNAAFRAKQAANTRRQWRTPETRARILAANVLPQHRK